MPAVPAMLITASALVILFLGVAHLWLTFVGHRLHPRQPSVRQAMETDHPVITRQTTMWKAWIGFNASHSYGAMLFGLVYGYLALVQAQLLFTSWFLQALGLVFLLGMLVLGWRYWFRIPLRGISLALVLYLLALVMALAQG